ncbi:MAG: hypothetical protein NT132_09215 [Microbacterium sp.]|uniref:hypothetical protein n=1 Tax=Microbacterium sp. TaxID=51671 RepID=UPI00262B2820|nr:hypothetical protein [Microbacterium sp.]MCX6502565.1 hypothetical protein [Microbacterium sp.]
MSEEHRKRPAFESPTRLAQAPEADSAMKRPISTVAGAVLVLLRVAAGLLWMLALSVQWRSIAHDIDVQLDGVALSADEVGLGLGVLWIVVGVVMATEVVLAVLILLGRNGPRVIVMLFAVISTSTSFATWVASGQEIRIDTTLLTVALDILILLALSSRSAAAYARRNDRP